MPKTLKILTYFISLFLIVILTATCAPSKKNPYLEKRKHTASQVNASQLGRNKYYFSKDYQKKLTKSYKKR